MQHQERVGKGEIVSGDQVEGAFCDLDPYPWVTDP